MQIDDYESGFTLVEVSVAAILVVTFALAFASSFSVAFGAARGNLLRQQATAVVNEELEYVRALTWQELAIPGTLSTAILPVSLGPRCSPYFTTRGSWSRDANTGSTIRTMWSGGT